MHLPTSTDPSISRLDAWQGGSAGLAWLFLGALLITNVPLLLCMPLTNDTVMYDLQAQNLLQGGVLYRDILEPNFPGVVWLHVAIRALLGWSSVAMRFTDMVIFFSSVGLLASPPPLAPTPRPKPEEDWAQSFQSPWPSPNSWPGCRGIAAGSLLFWP